MIPIIAVSCLQLIGFTIAAIKQNNTYVDLCWGLGFILVALTSWSLGTKHELATIVTSLVIVWGLRLFIHLAPRTLGKPEDRRYAAMRKNWGKSWLIQSFLKVFLLQGVLLLIISYPIVFINNAELMNIGFLQKLGVCTWFVGMFFEAVGDWQLRQFIKNPANKGKLMTEGLWRYTRHPNYFGEISLWWGIWLLTLPSGWWTFFAPLLLTLTIRYVSGIPMLENKYAGREDWEEYKKKTAMLIPWIY
jgi:steroid 5-alpha reductase family enzyme